MSDHVLNATMIIPARLVVYFEPGKIVGLTLPERRGQVTYFHVDAASWSNVNGENQHAISMSFVSPDRVAVKSGVPCFEVA